MGKAGRIFLFGPNFLTGGIFTGGKKGESWGHFRAEFGGPGGIPGAPRDNQGERGQNSWKEGGPPLFRENSSLFNREAPP